MKRFTWPSRDATALAWGLILAVGVCAPFFGNRRLFLLDWSYGPISVVSSGATLGLNGGLIAGNMVSVVMALLNHVFGALETWLPIFLFFPVACVGIARLAGNSKWAQLAAASLYAVNPFVLNRLFAGQIGFLLGYALFPFALASALHSTGSRLSRWLVPPLWWGVLTALSPHFAWIYGVALIGVVVSAAVYERFSLARLLGWFIFVAAIFAALSAYIYLPTVSTTLPTTGGSSSLALYRTASDPHLGLFANVASMYGFWRLGPGPQMAKDVVTGWPFLMAVLIIIIAIGVWLSFRGHRDIGTSQFGVGSTTKTHGEQGSQSEELEGFKHSVHGRSQLGLVLVVIGVVGYFLALGNQGPTGGIFTFAYNHLAFFDIMREPQKFLMLLVVAYAIFFGWGIDFLVRTYKVRSWLVTSTCAVLVAIALPLGYTVNIFDGIAHQILPSSLPSSYQSANALMGTGDGSVLSLPWHLYMSYPFTNNRVVANIAPSVFNRNVISGDNVQSSGVETQSTSQRSLYLESLFAHARQITNFGALVSPLGVQYITLAKAVDWRSYSWLSHQSDLRLVFNTPSLEIWRNTNYYGVGESISHLSKVSTFDELLKAAHENALSGAIYESPSSSPTGGSSVRYHASTLDLRDQSTVRELSPVSYQIYPGRGGWVALSAPFEKGWSINGRKAVDSVEGTLLVYVSARGGIVQFSPWSSVRTGYIVSGAVLLLCAVILLADFVRRRSKDYSGHHSA